MDSKPIETKKPVMFEPAKFAKKNCRNCGGTGVIRVHMKNPATGKVNPKDRNLETRPCGCALRKYQKANPPPLLAPKAAPAAPQD
jgi:hypothetical protein